VAIHAPITCSRLSLNGDDEFREFVILVCLYVGYSRPCTV